MIRILKEKKFLFLYEKNIDNNKNIFLVFLFLVPKCFEIKIG